MPRIVIAKPLCPEFLAALHIRIQHASLDSNMTMTVAQSRPTDEIIAWRDNTPLGSALTTTKFLNFNTEFVILNTELKQSPCKSTLLGNPIVLCGLQCTYIVPAVWHEVGVALRSKRAGVTAAPLVGRLAGYPSTQAITGPAASVGHRVCRGWADIILVIQQHSICTYRADSRATDLGEQHSQRVASNPPRAVDDLLKDVRDIWSLHCRPRNRPRRATAVIELPTQAEVTTCRVSCLRRLPDPARFCRRPAGEVEARVCERRGVIAGLGEDCDCNRLQNSSFLMQSSSFVIHNSSFLIQNSTFLLTRSPSGDFTSSMVNSMEAE